MFELIKVSNNENIRENSEDCFPDFFDDCNPTLDECMPNGSEY